MLRTLVIGLAAVVAAAPVAAQRTAAPASGVWFGGGVGPGWARVSCGICRADREGGPSGFVRLGGTVDARLRIGAEVAAWFRGDETVDQRLWAVSAIALWNPTLGSAFALRGGVGYFTHQADDGVDVVSSSALGPQLGVEYEFRAGPDWRITPYVAGSFGMLFGKVKFNGATAADDGTVSLLQVGVALRR